jgi:hypothetical protein
MVAAARALAEAVERDAALREELDAINEKLEAVAQAGGVVHVHEAPPDPAAAARQTARAHYLERLQRRCLALPLAALGGEDVTLDKVYIALDTKTPVPLTEEEGRESDRRRPGFLAPGTERDPAIDGEGGMRPPASPATCCRR